MKSDDVLVYPCYDQKGNTMSHLFIKKLSFSLIALSLSGSLAMAEGDHEKKGEHTPPPFVEACKDKVSGAACSFKGKSGNDVNGTCNVKNHPHTGKPHLICWNEAMKSHMPQAMPPK